MAYSVLTVVASAPVTTTGVSPAIHAGGPVTSGPIEWVSLLVSVTAASGTTPTCTITVDWSHDGVVFAATDPTEDGFAAFTAPGVKIKRLAFLAPYYRIGWAVAGTTPSFTFSVQELALDFE